jgi:hypothetical protein
MIKLNTAYTIENGDTVIFTEEKKDTIHGVYKDSALTGTLDGNVLKATFINSKVNAVGLMEITFNETGFDGKWKKGIEPGPMKGKWLGKLSTFKMIDEIESKVEDLNKNTDSLTDEQKECIDDVWEYNFLELTKEEWRTNRGFILAALKKDPEILGLLSEEFTKDREIVLEAVKHLGRLLEYADDSLKKDKELVLAAVKSSGSAYDQSYEDPLKYADEKLQFDPEIILEGIISSFKSEDDISLSEEDIQVFIDDEKGHFIRNILENLILKVRYTVLKLKKKEFELFVSELKSFINSNHECLWLLQVVYKELINVENILDNMPDDEVYYSKVFDTMSSFDTEDFKYIDLEFSPHAEFDTYFIDDEIENNWDYCKWSDSSNGSGMNFTEFIMKRAEIEWDSDSWSDIKFWNYGISSLWIGLQNYSFRHYEEEIDEVNIAIALYSVIDEKYEPIQESGCADRVSNIMHVIVEYLLRIKRNQYILDESDEDLEEFNGYQFDLKKVANNICNSNIFDGWPGTSEFLDD